jgi:hypothetical protein
MLEDDPKRPRIWHISAEDTVLDDQIQCRVRAVGVRSGICMQWEGVGE